MDTSTTSRLRRAASPSRSGERRTMLGRIVLAATCACACGQPAVVSTDYSFRTPFTDINPFTGMRQIEKWDLGGTAVAHRSFVRLTAEAQGSKGWMVSQQPLTMPAWSAMLEIRASGQSPHLYGDGLAIWLTKTHEHVEGPVFGREDKWDGLGLFFDTFQNIDHSHHHKHPYIYAMTNDGTKEYIPDADKADPGKQALPGAVDNSGCSYEFRYAEAREDVTVLNHTRVHFSYKDKTLKLRLQQTSVGMAKDWYQCFEMKDVELPNPAFFGVSSATGDLVDNHDIIQFVVRPIEGDADVDADYDTWEKAEKAEKDLRLADFDLRPPEALQRDYQRVLRAQAEAIKLLTGDVETLKQQLEFQLSAIATGVSSTKKNLDQKAEAMGNMVDHVKNSAEMRKTIDEQKSTIEKLTKDMTNVASNVGGGGWKLPFFVLFAMILGVAGVGYNKYKKLYGKSHLP